MTAWTREHCSCVVVQNYDYAAAAGKLAIDQRWLERNVSRLPHQKFGAQSAVFCDCDLRVIQAMNTVLPEEALDVIRPEADQAPVKAAENPKTATPAYAAARPARGRKRAAVQA